VTNQPPRYTSNSQTELSSDYPNELGQNKCWDRIRLGERSSTDLKLVTSNITTGTTDNYFSTMPGRCGYRGCRCGFCCRAKLFQYTLHLRRSQRVGARCHHGGGTFIGTNNILNAWIGNKYGTSNDRMGIAGLAQGLALRSRNNTIQTLTDNPMQDALLSRFSKVADNVQVELGDQGDQL